MTPTDATSMPGGRGIGVSLDRPTTRWFHRVMSNTKELKELIAAAEDAGWRVTRTRKSHFRLAPPDGGPFIITSGTPSCRRGVKNLKAHLRRNGLPV